MKRLALFICTLLCANVLMAQTRFWVGGLQYEVTSTNPPEVEVHDYWCSSSATIPPLVSYNNITHSVTSIGEEAFRNCSSLTSITIPNSVTSIGYSAFNGCSSLTSVTIPNSVTSIGRIAFLNCSSLTSITIPNSVTSVGGGVFYGCNNLTSVTLSNNITSLPTYDNYYGFFQGCSNLTSVTIPNSVTSIGRGAFCECSSLTSVTIGNSVTSIGDWAFQDCSSLTSVTIGNSVTSIGGGAFLDCSSLTSVTIGNSVTSIGGRAFSGCTSLTSVTIGNSVTSIGNSAFINCDFTSITIPNSVTSIGEDAFKYCSSLTSITIPNSVTSIGNYAFRGCSSLTSVTCLATIPPNVGNYVFPDSLTLSVPCVSLDAYSSPTSLWNMFFSDRISGIEYNVMANVNNADFGSVAIENNCSTATLTATATDCYQFVGWNDGNTENPRIVTLSSDTTLTANFEVMVVNNDITATICEGQVYNENGFNVSEAGTYTQTLQTANGCDSIVTLVVTTYPTFDTTITATINAGEMYSEFGFNESEAGTYVQNLQTVNGCDSTITLILDVNSSLMDVVDTEISFFPNPTKSEITFSQAIEKVEVIDLTGKAILTFTNAKTINIESLPAGAYYLRLTNEEKTSLQKVIKQ